MTPNDPRVRLDLAAARYLDALERDDFDATAALWERAETDPELEAVLRQVHAGLAAERAYQAATTIESAVERHMPSAEVIRPPTGPITVADVADELFHHTPDRLPAEAHAMNEKLRSSREAIPVEHGLPELTAWAEARFGSAPAEYWKAFRDAAIKVRSRSGADTEFQLAARGLKPKPEAPR